MKIDRVEAVAISIPLPTPVADAVRTITHRDHLIVRIASGGFVGVGFTLGYDAAPAMVMMVNQMFRPMLLGASAFETERLWGEMYRQSIQAGRRGAALRTISAIDIALWDLRGKVFNAPVMNLLGVQNSRLRCYATGGYYRGGQSVSDLVREVEGVVSQGFTALKLKVGGLAAREDAARIGAVRRALGDDVDLLLDANGGWKSAPEAISAMHRLEEFSPYWIEEPVRADNLTAMRKIAMAIETPVATGELESTRWAFAQLLEQEAASILQPDVTVVGGVSEWLKVAHLAASFDVPVAPHYNWDFHTQLCASIPNSIFVEYFLAGSGVKMFDRVVLNPMKPVNGYVDARTAPGFGIEYDWDEIASLRVG
jgi:D-arabinonate dehydratase